jgi:hypothetical protein
VVAVLQLCWDLGTLLSECFASNFYPKLNLFSLVLTPASLAGQKKRLKLACFETGSYWSQHGIPDVQESDTGIGHFDDIAAGETRPLSVGRDVLQVPLEGSQGGGVQARKFELDCHMYLCLYHTSCRMEVTCGAPLSVVSKRRLTAR